MIAMCGVAARMNAGMLVCSGDVLLLFNPLQIDFYGKGAAALSILSLIHIYASLKEVKKPDGSLGLPDAAMIRAAYDKYYQDEKFVRVLQEGVCPETKWVEGSNFVDVNVKVDPRTKRVIMMGAMDNLVKGAAGQAVQNMNLMFGLEESEGLDLVPMFP